MSYSKYCLSSSPHQQKCKCGYALAIRTSWTTQNPGRRFLACKFYDPETEIRGCDSFYWVDEDPIEWQTSVTNQLVLDKKLMKIDMNALKVEVADLNGQRRCLLNENENLKLQCKTLKAELKKAKKEHNECLGGGTLKFVIGIWLLLIIVGLGVVLV